MRLNIPYLQRFERLAAAAAAERKTLKPELACHGYVLFYDGKICGWAHDVIDSEAFRWRPGVIAVGVDGLGSTVYQATGGNYQAGAEKWSAIFNPSAQIDLVHAISGGFPIHLR